ncbi:MAG: hypothetical protein JO107_11875 [Hyphomicrobiales bacterium]|nr:hypothetical protein [Hyphomicrobiales bacterium]
MAQAEISDSLSASASQWDGVTPASPPVRRCLAEALGLDNFGVDFALAPDGRLLLFEANAAMVILDPPEDPMWGYRREAIADARAAVRAMTVNAALRGARWA